MWNGCVIPFPEWFSCVSPQGRVPRSTESNRNHIRTQAVRDGQNWCQLFFRRLDTTQSTGRQYLEIWLQTFEDTAIGRCTRYRGATRSHQYFNRNAKLDRHHSEYAASRGKCPKKKRQTFSGVQRPSINSVCPVFLSCQMCLCTTQVWLTASFRLDAWWRLAAMLKIVFSIPNDALTDSFALATFPLYEGSITIPDNITVIVMPWSMPGTHGDYLRSESYQSLHPCLYLYLR